MNEKIKFEEYLDKFGTLTYKNKGISMLPMLVENRDLFTIQKKTDKRCEKYDVVLYKRGSEYVLHRVIKVNQHDYTILGDNCIYKEYGIKDDDILGVMSSFVHNGRTYQKTDVSYCIYSRCRLATYPVRIFGWKIKKMALGLKRRFNNEKK